MAVYVQIPNVTGGATEQNHTGWIQMDSLQFGVARSLNNPLGHATSREAGQPTVSEIIAPKRWTARPSSCSAGPCPSSTPRTSRSTSYPPVEPMRRLRATRSTTR